MSLLEALAGDPRFPRLSDRKAVAVEAIVKRLDSVLAGDDPYPANWLSIVDHARQEAGIAPMSILNT